MILQLKQWGPIDLGVGTMRFENWESSFEKGCFANAVREQAAFIIISLEPYLSADFSFQAWTPVVAHLFHLLSPPILTSIFVGFRLTRLLITFSCHWVLLVPVQCT